MVFDVFDDKWNAPTSGSLWLPTGKFRVASHSTKRKALFGRALSGWSIESARKRSPRLFCWNFCAAGSLSADSEL